MKRIMLLALLLSNVFISLEQDNVDCTGNDKIIADNGCLCNGDDCAKDNYCIDNEIRFQEKHRIIVCFHMVQIF